MALYGEDANQESINCLTNAKIHSFQQAIDAAHSGVLTLNCPLISHWLQNEDVRDTASLVMLLTTDRIPKTSLLLPPSGAMPLLP